jgi:hypothetical protein
MVAHCERLLDAPDGGEKLAIAVQPVGLVRIEGKRLFEGILGRDHFELDQIGVPLPCGLSYALQRL